MSCCFLICDRSKKVTKSFIKSPRKVKLEVSWKAVLSHEFSADYMVKLRNFLLQEKRLGKKIFPSGGEIFKALDFTPIKNTKVVILGQDPYHGIGQAHGLCFSVKPGVDIPPSLSNIYKELQSDVDFMPPSHGCLTSWAMQGVLLLNSVLTVEAHRAASHQGRGWERFTDRIISLLNNEKRGLVFLLWGNYAQKKGAIIDQSKHLVLQSAHPSPLSANRGFFGNNHFSQVNDYLVALGEEPIDWQLPEL
ncbi:MAG: uracil-DNA glycosylase [Gammaproteobacteria bacterium]|nr:uracil-DNA glycosylase [Gammaproteobacteria bacterium]